MLGKQSFYKVFSNDSYERLKFYIFASLGLNPDYAPEQYMYIYIILKQKLLAPRLLYTLRFNSHIFFSHYLGIVRKEKYKPNEGSV